MASRAPGFPSYMPSNRILGGGWEQLKRLGEGGQSEVFLARSPKRVEERKKLLHDILQVNPWANVTIDEKPGRVEQFAIAISNYARSDTPEELGAFKVFKIPANKDEANEALGRLRNEISILEQGKPGLVKLLDSSDRSGWMVTQYMQNDTLDKQPRKYKGDAKNALRAFRSLVQAVTSLHKENIVHRDIKPQNVFLGDEDGQLVLGDFGIVYIPDQAERPTQTNERVGPRDYMPQWGDLGERLEKVHTNFDVYMLGKLLWCMVTGRLKLPREYHRRPAYDVCALFPNDPNMSVINEILERCVVEEPEDCLASAKELLQLVDEHLTSIERGLPRLDKNGKLTMPCRMCGRGFYEEHYPEGHYELRAFDARHVATNPAFLRIFVCNVCTHYELFAPGNPEEAAKRKWTPWRQQP